MSARQALPSTRKGRHGDRQTVSESWGISKMGSAGSALKDCWQTSVLLKFIY